VSCHGVPTVGIDDGRAGGCGGVYRVLVTGGFRWQRSGQTDTSRFVYAALRQSADSGMATIFEHETERTHRECDSFFLPQVPGRSPNQRAHAGVSAGNRSLIHCCHSG
jgi:hypothetical protein